MKNGKIAAQCSHGTLGAYKKMTKRDPRGLKLWLRSGQAKVVLQVPNEEEM